MKQNINSGNARTDTAIARVKVNEAVSAFTVNNDMVKAIISEITDADTKSASARRWNAAHGVKVHESPVLNTLGMGIDKAMTSAESGLKYAGIRLSLIRASGAWESALDESGKTYNSFSSFVKGTFKTHAVSTMLNAENVATKFYLPTLRGETEVDYLNTNPGVLQNLVSSIKEPGDIKKLDAAIKAKDDGVFTTKALSDRVSREIRKELNPDKKPRKEANPGKVVDTTTKAADNSEPVEETSTAILANLMYAFDVEVTDGEFYLTVFEGERMIAAKTILEEALADQDKAKNFIRFILNSMPH